MSFSSDIKTKLKINGCGACFAAYALGLIGFGAEIRADCVRFGTENKYVAQSVENDLSEYFGVKCKCENIHGYRITVSDNYDRILSEISEIANGKPNDIILRYMQEECCKKSFIIGAFMTGGSVSDPQKSYHIEFDTRYKEFSDILCTVFGTFGINARTTLRKGHWIVYVKEYESIAAILSLIGAGGAALELYTIQIEKEMRNDINRRINFETANVDKTAKAAAKQLQAINILKRSGEFEKLPDSLRDIATLRTEYPEANLKQLGEMLTPPLGKSGVNHRLEKIIDIAGI